MSSKISVIPLLILFCCVKLDAAPAKSHTAVNAQLIAKQLKEASDLWYNGNKIDAVVLWRKVQEEEPDNQEANTRLNSIRIVYNEQLAHDLETKEQAPLAQVQVISCVNEAKKALTRYAKAFYISEIAEVLDDQTADAFARDLLVMYREGIQNAATGTHTPDYKLSPDFEKFIEDNNLAEIISAFQEFRAMKNDDPSKRLYGRKLLKALSKWTRRLSDSQIDVKIVVPYGSHRVADDFTDCEFIVMDNDLVYINNTILGPCIPLQAKIEDGKWRIGPQPGHRMHYDIIPMLWTHKRRMHDINKRNRE